jgi:hypothetical protein
LKTSRERCNLQGRRTTFLREKRTHGIQNVTKGFLSDNTSDNGQHGIIFGSVQNHPLLMIG